MNKSVSAGIVVMLMFLGGIVIAFIEHALYTSGILIDEYVTGTITIGDIMIITIIMFALIGVVIAVAKN